MTTTQDPAARLDYSWDWTDLLDDGDTVVTATVTVVVGTVTATSVTIASPHVTAWVAGGALGETAAIVCHVTTAAGRVDERTLRLYIGDQ